MRNKHRAELCVGITDDAIPSAWLSCEVELLSTGMWRAVDNSGTFACEAPTKNGAVLGLFSKCLGIDLKTLGLIPDNDEEPNASVVVTLARTSTTDHYVQHRRELSIRAHGAPIDSMQSRLSPAEYEAWIRRICEDLSNDG